MKSLVNAYAKKAVSGITGDGKGAGAGAGAGAGVDCVDCRNGMGGGADGVDGGDRDGGVAEEEVAGTWIILGREIIITLKKGGGDNVEVK